MNIKTESINSKKFHSAIDAHLLKYSQEYFVLATLRFLFPSEYNTLQCGDAPDLQDTQHNIGIEVTSAVDRNDMKASRAFSDLKKCNDESASKYRHIIDTCGYSYSTGNEKLPCIQKSGTSDPDKEIFQTAILNKVQKSHSYRERFAHLGLAVLFPEIPLSTTEDHCISWLKDILPENDSFDFVYILSHRFCIYYNAIDGSQNCYIISKDESHALRVIARMTAEGKLTLDSPEWL